MKKGTSINYKIKRLSSSAYFKDNFLDNEKEEFEKLGLAVLPLNSSLEADIIITNTHSLPDQLKENEIKACKLMIHSNSGYDNFSLSFVKDAPFPIIIGNEIRAQAVTSFILSEVFSHFSKSPIKSNWDKTRSFERSLISTKKIVIIGFGAIGNLVYQTLKLFNSNIQIYDPYKGHSFFDCDSADLVILTCGQNEKNINIINKDILSKLSNNFLLINSARGKLVELEDLRVSLENNPNSYAVLDVFPNEPFDFSYFNEIKNIKLTSHIAGVFNEIDIKTIQFETNVIKNFLQLSSDDFLKTYQESLLKNKIHDNILI